MPMYKVKDDKITPIEFTTVRVEEEGRGNDDSFHLSITYPDGRTQSEIVEYESEVDDELSNKDAQKFILSELVRLRVTGIVKIKCEWWEDPEEEKDTQIFLNEVITKVEELKKELDVSVWPEHYTTFISDMLKAGLEVRAYRGRFFYKGPAVEVSFFGTVYKNTTVACQHDNLGLEWIVYPK